MNAKEYAKDLPNFLAALRKEGPDKCQKCELYFANFSDNHWEFKCEAAPDCYQIDGNKEITNSQLSKDNLSTCGVDQK